MLSLLPLALSRLVGDTKGQVDGNKRLDACNKRSVHDTINVRCPSQAHTVFSRNPETASERGNGVCDRSPCMWRRFSTSSAPVRCRIPPRPTATPGLPRGIGARDGGVSVVVGCLAAAKGRIRRPRQRRRVPTTAAVDAVQEPILKTLSPHAVQPRGPARAADAPTARGAPRVPRPPRGSGPGPRTAARGPPRPRAPRRRPAARSERRRPRAGAARGPRRPRARRAPHGPGSPGTGRGLRTRAGAGPGRAPRQRGDAALQTASTAVAGTRRRCLCRRLWHPWRRRGSPRRQKRRRRVPMRGSPGVAVGRGRYATACRRTGSAGRASHARTSMQNTASALRRSRDAASALLLIVCASDEHWTLMVPCRSFVKRRESFVKRRDSFVRRPA